MNSPICEVLSAKVFTQGRETVLDVALHVGVNFRLVFTDPVMAVGTARDLMQAGIEQLQKEGAPGA